MEQSHLVELIRQLTLAEKEEIMLFASLPSFNNGKMKGQVLPLLIICMGHPWGETSERLEKKMVFSRLFPDQEYVEGRLEKVMVEAHKVVRTFLTLQHFVKDDNEFKQFFEFSKVIRKMGLDVRYQQLFLKLQRIQQEVVWKNEDYFDNQFILEYAIHEEACLHNQVKGDLNVPNAIYALELHGHLNRLALLNRFLLQQKVAKIIVPDIIKTIIDENHLPARYLEASATIKLNYEIFCLLRKEVYNTSDVRTLFDLLLLYENELTPESLREFYTYLRNICVMIINSDAKNDEINFTLHDIYKDNLRRGYLHYEGRLHSGTYLAVNNNAIKVNFYEWALAFIENYKKEIIDDNESKDFYRLNKAIYFFAIGKFAECLEHIPDTSPSVAYLLQGKRLEIKALYELKSELFSYRLDNFKMFMIRTSSKLLSENQKQINVDFANLLSQISNSIPGDSKRSDLIIKRIQLKKQTAEWQWLMGKAKELKLGVKNIKSARFL